MEALLLVIEGWWWVAPAAAAAGTATYAGVTARSRRARRLAVDAARHEEGVAYRALMGARAQARARRAEHAATRARAGTFSPEAQESRRVLQAAKRAEKSALLELRATRAQVRAAVEQYRTAGREEPLPLEKVMADHDAVIARWLSYELDAEKVIAHPAMSDARNPATLAFLQARAHAQRLRPASAADRMTPEQFVAYRDAVRTLERAFATAERQAR